MNKTSDVMTKDVGGLEGKMIKTVKLQAINCWIFYFTDGTEKVLWAEIDGPLNLGQLWVSDTL